VGIPVPFDALDDPETLDSIDVPPRAIPVEPFHPRPPDLRPPADPRGRLWSQPPNSPAPPGVLKPFFNQ
jgi:hypothetical protein